MRPSLPYSARIDGRVSSRMMRSCFDHLLGRSGDQGQILHLLFERRVDSAHVGVARPQFGHRLARPRPQIARRRRPHRMGQADELALHPHEFAGVADGLLFGLRDVASNQVAALRRSRLVAGFLRDLVVDFPDLLALFDRQVERDVGIAMLRRPHDGLAAGNPGNPDPRMRLLHRQRPRIDHAQLVMLAFPAPRPRRGPGLDDQVVGFLEALAVEGGIGVGLQRLDAAAAHKARYQPPFRDHVDHRQLFGQPHRIIGHRQRDCPAARFSPSW